MILRYFRNNKTEQLTEDLKELEKELQFGTLKENLSKSISVESLTFEEELGYNFLTLFISSHTPTLHLKILYNEPKSEDNLVFPNCNNYHEEHEEIKINF